MRVFVALLILFLLHSCGEDESSQSTNTSTANEVVTKERSVEVSENNQSNNTPTQPSTTTTHATPNMDRSDKEIFSMSDFSQDHTQAKKFIVYKEGIDFSNIKQKIVVINFITQSCAPCIGQFPYLSDLQNKYKKDLFLMGIVLDSTMSKKELSDFANQHHAVFFLSDSEQNMRLAQTIAKQLGIKDLILPLMVIYKEGSYYIHYEGSAPIEMIESDIQQALSK